MIYEKDENYIIWTEENTTTTLLYKYREAEIIGETATACMSINPELTLSLSQLSKIFGHGN